ncbi:hypothetical protein AJ78_00111 [Emergomyces pasteurianus Ep9510]|uniref:Uncharacterized protein n=1 Tax=Emergomyces pasteurianus Ep9510 TaxID=1447872 RepID=A0A1J9QX70_9EURO|nr:hypothetical protein AJ78_00111 [Emergomyces pasteurianus Ep9510]
MEGLDTGMTAGEQRIFYIAMTCTTNGLTGIKVNYEQLARKAGLKNAGCASVLYGNARRKLLAATKHGEGTSTASNDNGTGHKTPSKASKVTKRTPKSSARGKDKTTKTTMTAATLQVEPSPTKTSKIKGETDNDADMTGMMHGYEKVKHENGINVSTRIKTEFANDLANEMIEGTSYPRSELEWSFFEQSLWHVETYNGETEDEYGEPEHDDDV